MLIFFAVIGAILTGIACSLIGVFVVRMNLSSLGFCMSHAAFAGAALGIFLNHDPLLLAMIFSACIALILGPIAEKAKLETNVIIGVLFSLMIALALLFLNLSPGEAASSSALGILWGSIIALKLSDVLMLSGLTVVIVILMLLFSKEFYAIMFDRKLAEACGISTKPFYYLILFLTSITIALSLKLVGGLLIFALMVNPASTAYQFFYDMRKIVFATPIIGAFSCLLGLYASFVLDFPVGSSIAIVSSLLFALAVIISPKRKKEVNE